jgi:hypothetical protein
MRDGRARRFAQRQHHRKQSLRGQMNGLKRWWRGVLLVAWFSTLVFWIAHSTLALPYLSDDFEHVQLIAQIRAGLEPGRDLLTVPFHSQTLVLLRLLFWFGTLAGGMNLTWVRLGICAVHIAGAMGCAILCTRWTGSKFAGFIAGTLYAGALGFIGEEIWWPSSGIFCLGATFLILAMVAQNPDAKNPKLALAVSVLMLVLAALGLNGILVAAVGIPIFLRRREAIVFGAAIAVLLALVLWQQSSHYDEERLRLSLRGLELGAWLVFTAPFRFLSAWTTFALPGFQTIWKLAPLAWLPLLASAWRMNSRYRRVLLGVWTPAILLALLVGMARADYPYRFGPGSLYTADRYYYAFLFPLVTHCALSLTSFKLPRWGTPALFVVLAGALLGSRAHYLANVPRASFEATGHALEQGRLLVETIRSSKTRPLLLSDASIPMDGAHLNAVTLAFLIYSEYPHGIPGVSLVKGPLDAQQTAIENSLLKPWARAASSSINFKEGSYEENLTSGFSWPEPPFRWMGARGSLHLIAAAGDLVITAYAPVDQLRRTIHVEVAVNGKAVGELAISQPGTHDYRLPVGSLQPGSTANITLTSDFVWRARDIFPQSLDERDLSIAISAIGFGVRK